MLALRMPDPRGLLPRRLLEALHLVNHAYRVLTSTEPLWDAIEGAARATCERAELRVPTRVHVDSLLKKATMEGPRKKDN